MHVFITGDFQVGKSTLINKVLDALPVRRLGGFRTVSVADIPNAFGSVYIVRGSESLSAGAYCTGERGALYGDENRVGIRGNNGPSGFPEVFDRFGVMTLADAENCDLILMDEIGKMERNASVFTKRILELLDGNVPVFGVLRKEGNTPLQEQIRNHPNVRLIEVTADNRDQLAPELIRLLSGQLKKRISKPDVMDFSLKLWNSRKKSSMSHTKADWDERAINWERELQEDSLRKNRSERRVAETVKFLKAHGALEPEFEVMDIGCGPGRFVTEFAKNIKYASGIDISPNMCRFGLEYAHSQNVYNVDFTPCDFKQADIKELGWEKKFDLVYSSITPALSTYECFRKSEQMSRGFCFQSNFVKMSDPIGEKIIKEVFREEDIIPERGVTGLVALFNILCMDGRHPEVTYYKEADTEILEPNEDFIKHLLKYTSVNNPSENIKRKLVDAAKDHADSDGKIKRYTEVIYSWILWDVR